MLQAPRDFQFVIDKIKANIKINRHGCWIWQKSLSTSGYGFIYFDGKQHCTSRVSYEVFMGPIPEGMLVCHDCPGGDDRACCNPDHLWLGTVLENTADMFLKRRNRHLSGEDHPNSKITNSQRRYIIRSKKSTAELALKFGVTTGHIRKIVRGDNLTSNPRWHDGKRVA